MSEDAPDVPPSQVDLGSTLASPARPGAGVSERIGRYEVQALLGAGAMGRVLSAWDPALKRQVALKMLKSDGASDDLRQRLLREAEAAARVTHPNVVTVHDVGTHEGQVFVAMELVDGSLRDWSRRPRSVDEVVRLFRDVAWGLAAVHDAGLVHRDFKPDNVLVRGGQVPLISDFGLVGALAGLEARPFTPGDDGLHLTHTGTLLGTPVYMAPELYDGKPATPASDQFAFAVSLHEALFGQRPFDASGIHELADVIRRGERRPPTRPVPAWLGELLDRALQVDPARRYPSMQAVVQALDDGPQQARRRRVGALAAFAAVVVGGGAIVGTTWASRPSCAGFGEAKQRVWTQRFQPQVSARAPALVGPLEAAFAAWASSATGRCEAFADGALGVDAWAREKACHEAALEDLELAARLAATASAEAGALLERQGKSIACASRPVYRRRQPLPPEEAAREAAAHALEESLGALTLLETDGDGAKARAAAALKEALASGYHPAAARAAIALGTVHLNTGDATQALDAFRQARAEAEAANDDELLSSSAVLQAHVECLSLGDTRACVASLEVARTQLERTPNPSLEPLYLDVRVGLDLKQLQPDAAIARLRALPAAPDERARQRRDALLLDALLADGRFEEAGALVARGADTPDARTPGWLVSRAMTQLALGELEAAEQTVMTLAELVKGREELATWEFDVLSFRAQLAAARGQVKEAIGFREAMLAANPEGGQDPLQVAELLEAGQVAEARTFERSILLAHPRFEEHAVDERALTDLLALGLLQRATGRHAEALRTMDWLEQAIALQASPTAWALADVLRVRCMMALEHEALEVVGPCLARLEAVMAPRPGRLGPPQALPLPILRAEWHLRRGEPREALAVIDSPVRDAAARGYGDATFLVASALRDEAFALQGERARCASLAKTLDALAVQSPGFFGIDRARQAATRRGCR